MENSRLTKILIEATSYSMENKSADLGDCLTGRGLEAQDIQALLQLAHDEIEHQHFEDAPKPKTQAFLDAIKKIKNQYPEFF